MIFYRSFERYYEHCSGGGIEDLQIIMSSDKSGRPFDLNARFCNSYDLLKSDRVGLIQGVPLTHEHFAMRELSVSIFNTKCLFSQRNLP
jgi:hypothetical protein